MSNLGKLVIAITATTKGLEKAVTKSKSLLGGLTKGAAIPAVLGGAGAGAAASSLARIGDQYAYLGKQLEYMTGNAQDAERVQEQLHKISQETGTTMEANAGTFVKLSLASKQTGLTMDENLETIATLNKIMALTGTSGQQASAAVLQLSQALTSGKLAGDEFRSISENAPGLLMAIADASGIAAEDLREMSSQGKLTSQLLGEAFVTLNEQGTAVFGELPQTVSRGMNAIALSFGKVWDYINDNTGIIGRIEDALFQLAYYIEENAYQIEKWVNDGWNALIEKGPGVVDTITAIWGAIETLVGWITKAVEGYGVFLERLRAQNELMAAYQDLRRQEQYTQRQLEEGGYTQEEFDAIDPYAARNNVMNQVNNFNQNVSRSDVENITGEAALQASRI